MRKCWETESKHFPSRQHILTKRNGNEARASASVQCRVYHCTLCTHRANECVIYVLRPLHTRMAFNSNAQLKTCNKLLVFVENSIKISILFHCIRVRLQSDKHVVWIVLQSMVDFFSICSEQNYCFRVAQSNLRNEINYIERITVIVIVWIWFAHRDDDNN